MAGVASALTTTPTLQICCLRPKSCILERNPSLLSFNATNFSKRLHLAVALPSPSQLKERKHRSSTAAKASVGSVDYAVEPETKVKFEKDLTVPGCSSPMVLVGTGFREKVFAIIGVKVYAAGFYANASLKEGLGSLKGRSLSDISEDPSVLKTILQNPAEKSLKISLVRDVDGNTFWNALNDVISPRIKRPTSEDETALSKFRTTFDGRPLKKGTIILLTWAEPSKMLVSIGSEELLPSTVDAVIESSNVTESLFDAFFGDTPVSPSLKASVADRLGTLLSSNL